MIITISKQCKTNFRRAILKRMLIKENFPVSDHLSMGARWLTILQPKNKKKTIVISRRRKIRIRIGLSKFFGTSSKIGNMVTCVILPCQSFRFFSLPTLALADESNYDVLLEESTSNANIQKEYSYSYHNIFRDCTLRSIYKLQQKLLLAFQQNFLLLTPKRN